MIADLRGYGASSAPPGDAEHQIYSKRAMAEDCLAVMRALGHAAVHGRPATIAAGASPIAWRSTIPRR